MLEHRDAIGIAGPFTLEPFRPHLQYSGALPQGLGGTPVVSLVQGLLARNRRVVVFTLDQLVSDEVVVEGPQLKICVGPYRPRHRARDLFAVERAYLHNAILRERPSLLHAHWTYEFALPALETEVPTLVTAHDAPLRILAFTPDPYRAARTLMAWEVAHRAKCMTAVSEHIARQFRRHLGYRGSLEVIPNAVSQYALDLGKRRQRRGHGGDVFATVLTGWSAVKNGDTALRAFALVRQALPQARLQMYGYDYGPGEQAEIWARRHGCSDGITFCGMLAHEQLLASLASGTDVLVHPAREEAFCMAVAEAMALGIPVIGGARSGAIPELLEHGHTGLLADVSCERALAQAMLRLAGDQHLAVGLGAAACECARLRYAPETSTAAYEQIYQQLAPAYAELAA